ncbi:hypothetical protein L596_022938 [Steinernema carpocapsae]|uniref:Uncharacterized protein n=1 Tax=Steinernema carpocapsae TaxID=34508 RepID=A0A4U5MC25_STECR|nr:hypothetical protein L596_022938 [Steinernema carpocapsae]
MSLCTGATTPRTWQSEERSCCSEQNDGGAPLTGQPAEDRVNERTDLQMNLSIGPKACQMLIHQTWSITLIRPSLARTVRVLLLPSS